MTTAAGVPVTRDELEGDEAFETLRATGRRKLLKDAFVRFRAADGTSHARALAFQLTLTLLPALIALVGLAAAVDQEEVRRTVQDSIDALAPGAAGDILTQALRQGSDRAAQESGEAAFFGGASAALLAGTTAMAQVERATNRLYGVERDRPLLRRYLVAFLLAVTAGVLALLSVVVLVGGGELGRAAGWDDDLGQAWRLVKWPIGLALAITSIALLFQHAPYRRQPEASWLAVGAAVATALWLVFMQVLDFWFDQVESFGATYGPIAGTIGLLIWAFLSSVALLYGLSVAAQLEAVRAGAPDPRVARQQNL